MIDVAGKCGVIDCGVRIALTDGVILLHFCAIGLALYD
jgi:hypothetical protein